MLNDISSASIKDSPKVKKKFFQESPEKLNKQDPNPIDEISPLKDGEMFPTAYHMAMKIKNNEKAMIKLMSKGILPKELDDPIDDEINRLNDGRKRYLANYSSKIGISNEENLFLQSMQIDEEYGTTKNNHKKSNSESKAKKFMY